MPWDPNTADADLLETLAWREARRRYTGDATALQAVAGLGLSVDTLRRRARVGKWRKIDRLPEGAATPMPSCADVQTAPLPPRQGPAPANASPETLSADAAALAREALDLVRAGDSKAADAALKAADRLLRIQKRLGPAEKTVATTGYSEKAQAARDRVFAMSEAELMAEIKRIAAEAGRI